MAGWLKDRNDLNVPSAMENSGHSNTQHFRPLSYADLCRPPGATTDHPSALSAAYHSRYLASLPLSTGSGFPFLSGMFPGSPLPTTPATSSFRAPSAPGIASMRQFWPPTPPPEGYGRYGVNTSLFPLYGSVSPSSDTAAYVTQGLATRHLPSLIDSQKDQGYYTPGYGLTSPLTSSGHAVPATSFSHVIPSLDKHSTYGHLTLTTKEMENSPEASESPSSKAVINPYKHDKYSSCPRTRPDSVYEKIDHKKPPSSYSSKEKQEDVKPLRKLDSKLGLQSQTKISPCEIEVNYPSSSIKADMLSPPLDSPRPEVNLSLQLKKQDTSPMNSPPLFPSGFPAKLENQCSTCAAHLRGVGIATKLRDNHKRSASTSSAIHVEGNMCPTTVAPIRGTTASDSMSSAAPANPKLPEAKETVNTTSSSSFVKSQLSLDSVSTTVNGTTSTLVKSTFAHVKHVTAAVIPTAPKQMVQKDTLVNSVKMSLPNPGDELEIQTTNTCHSDVSKPLSNASTIKSEALESSNNDQSDRVTYYNCPTSDSCVDTYGRSNALSRVKDMIKAIEPRMISPKLPQNTNKGNDDFENSKNGDFENKVALETSQDQTFLPNFSTKPESSESLTKHRSPTLKTESFVDANHCISGQNSSVPWTKATVLPFNRHKSIVDDHQAMNLTITRKGFELPSTSPIVNNGAEDGLLNVVPSSETIKITMENVSLTNTGIIGVCHPNSKKTIAVANSVNKLSCVSASCQPEIATEVHVSSKSSLQTISHNPSSPNGIKTSSIMNTSIHSRTVKSERINTRKGKIGDIEKVLSSPRGALATLAPKITKKVAFLKDSKTSHHTLSTSSSVSSTSIVFPASVNPCIPVGIAIAQQRQDSSSSGSVGKTQSSTAGVVASTSQSNHISTEIQPSQEILRDHKPHDNISTSSTVNSESTNFLVAQGPTILSRQWESEAVTRATLPSPWVTHGPIVAPALWIGQGTYASATAPAATAIPPPPPLPPPPPPPTSISSVENSPIALPPGGYQLARDSITGHLFLIPAANIVDRTSLWPSYNTSASNSLPIQQLVTQQHHTQFEQVIPQASESEPVQDCLSLTVQQTHMGEPVKELNALEASLPASNTSLTSYKSFEDQTKSEDRRDSTNAVPLASGQTFTFTTFPTHCDPSSFSYVLQSSTVMHLAHTQTTSSIQTESGKRSQGTSPLHCVSPSPSPASSADHASDESPEDGSDNESESVACSELTQVKLFPQIQSVTAAIQVDMDSQTNSEEDEEESYLGSHGQESQNIEMSDSANQTEGLIADCSKSDVEQDFADFSSNESVSEKPSCDSQDAQASESSDIEQPKKENDSVSNTPLEILATETELAPSLPVESQPVMDFIDHHGLNLLVDSIEEFASREKDVIQKQQEDPIPEKFQPETLPVDDCDRTDFSKARPEGRAENSPGQSYRALDTSCTDGLGLLCALAEQRFLEESLNSHHQDETSENARAVPATESPNEIVEEPSVSSTFEFLESESIPSEKLPEHLRACELEMRKRLADLQRKYKEKELELARLNPNIKLSDDEKSDGPSVQWASKKRSKHFASTNLKRKAIVLRKNKSGFAGHSLNLTAQKFLVKKSLLQQKSLRRLGKSTKHSSHFIRKRRSSDEQKIVSLKKSEVSSSAQDKNDTSQKQLLPKEKTIHKTGIYVLSSGNSKDPDVSEKRERTQEKDEEARGKKTQKHSFNNSLLIRYKKSLKGKNFKKTQREFKRSKPSAENSTQEDDDDHSSYSSKDSKSRKNIPESQDNEVCDHSKAPIFDESAWFIRRSERIFLSDARSPASQQVASTCIARKISKPSTSFSVKLDTGKKLKLKTGSSSPKKRHASDSSDRSRSSESTSSSDCESSGECSSQSENIPLSVLAEQTANKDKSSRLSVDSSNSSVPSEDVPLSVLKIQNSTKAAEVKSCILTPSELQDKARVLILDEGLFYAGHVTAIQAPDVYGIILDGERAHRPRIFSREEILNAAVLEIKPDNTSQLPEGCRICAYWSQQYRCLYPGTVTKASSPLPDPSVLYVEFDDGDSGRIPLEDMRMLPPDFPIVSMEPNPLLILGKRRARLDHEYTGEQRKLSNASASKSADRESNSSPKLKKRKLDSSKDKSSKKDTQQTTPSYSRSQSTSDNPSSGKPNATKSHSPKRKDPGKRTENKVTSQKTEAVDGPAGPSAPAKPKKHKKHKDDHKHHHRHHHHHHRHHHKKHKTRKLSHSGSEKAVISMKSKVSGPSGSFQLSAPLSSAHSLCTEQKSDLTMKIKTSPSPHTPHDQEAKTQAAAKKAATSSKPAKKLKAKKHAEECKPEKRKDRLPSVEKSKIAAFLPVRQLWRWSGKSYKRPGTKGKAKKEFYRAIQRGKELLRVGDCAVFLSTGRPHLPYIGRIETMWESWGGKMDVKVKWFYHPEETKNSKKLTQLKPGALFQSPHFDENDVQTISHKCEVLPWGQFLKKKEEELSPGSLFDNNDTYYLAGTYDPITGSLTLEADIPKLSCLTTSDG